MAWDSRLPPSRGRPARRAARLGAGARSEAPPPLSRSASHVRWEPGAKSFVDDLILGQGFVRSRAATSLRSIESHPLSQAFVAEEKAAAGQKPTLPDRGRVDPARASPSAPPARTGGGVKPHGPVEGVESAGQKPVPSPWGDRPRARSSTRPGLAEGESSHLFQTRTWDSLKKRPKLRQVHRGKK